MEMPLFDNLAAQCTHPAMGTVMTHKAFGEYAEESLAAVRMEIERLDGLFSRFRPDSEISQIKRAAGLQQIKVCDETIDLLSRAGKFSQDYPAYFDITISPLVDLWRSAKSTQLPPHESKIKETLSLVNYRDLSVHTNQATAGLHRPGQCIDLGGIAKGYAANQMLEVYKAFGMQSACSNLGGNVISLGTKPDGSPWKIGIQHPRQENCLIGAVSDENKTVVTSGDYQRYYLGKNGQRYHHILSPVTGYPSESGLISVSIVAEDSMIADALSTIVFMAGLDKGLEILSAYPQVEAILVDSKMKVFITKGLRDRFQTAEAFRVTILNP